MAIPDYQSLMLPLLRLGADGELKVSDAISRLAEEFALTEDERAEVLPSGRQTVLANRVHWAKTYLAKAGLVEATRRGHFKISPRGIEVLKDELSRIDVAYLDQFPEFVEFRKRGSQTTIQSITVEPTLTPTRTPDETMRLAHSEIEATLKQELLDRILAAPPAFFERIIVRLLLAMGYGGTSEDPGRTLGKSGDGGVDGVIDQDSLGLDRVYIQAKRYAPEKRIGAPTIREFFGSLDRFKAAKGVLVTTSEFTADAMETAQYMSKRIVLIDGNRLAELMIRYNVGCRVKDTLYVKDVDEDFFLE